MLSFLLLVVSLLPSVLAQGFPGFNNFQTATASSTTSASTKSTSTRTSTSTSATATSTGVYGQCVDACITQDPIVNHCNGTETGSALDQCKCRSYTPSNDPLISCINDCPQEQQYNFANTLPKLCAQTLFLGLNLTDTPKPNAINSAASATFGVAGATATASGNSGATVGTGANILGLFGVSLGIAALL
ncbi:hypothetical protein H2200_005808 [Cladophialophora chaetospira]|uniref:Uncharacterized protein n=1 Tax=Cladophialophora chaetospira TaxID=386627 RepID=A0AA39CIG5_9EURO|nr:hypothetical protein H2200_005808 [Cladophialophora chaetospira]